MDKRPEIRVGTDIPVRVWGMDAEGRPFFQTANASNLSSDGALLSRINHPLKPGDVIGIQYGDKKARFRVVWMVDAGLIRKIESGVKILEKQQTPWQDLTPQLSKASQYEGKNKRRFVRHKILFPIEIGFGDAGRAHMQTNATDIGGRGCYVESLVPLPTGTHVHICFWMDSQKIRTTGVVRASDPGVGMGIEFTALDNDIQARLQQLLEKMDTGFAGCEAANTASSGE